MAEIRETCIDSSDGTTATISSNELKWINKIYKLKDQRNEDVEILMCPENNYGYILARVPKTWMKLSPPKTVNRTEEQKAEFAERMSKARKNNM